VKLHRDIFKQRLASLSPRQESKITALVEEYRADVVEVQRAALRYTQDGDIQASRALSVIAQLDETAVESLATTISTQKLVPDTSLLMDLVNGVCFAEAAVVKRLTAVLSNTRLVPQPPEMRDMEEVGPPNRICDEAYVKLRRILNPEPYLQHLMESRHFLSLPDDAKNQEIKSWSDTGRFTRFLGDVDTEER
jgi:hypothetical protein